MNKTLTRPITLILVAMLGLLMALAAQAQAAPFDAGPVAELDASSQPAGDASEPDKPATEPAAAESEPGSIEAAAEDAVLAPAERAEKDPVGLATEVAQDVREGNWRHAVSGLLAFLMLGLGRFREKIPLFEGDRGGAILVGVLGMAGAFSTALASSAPLDLKLILGAFGVVWGAVGGYTWVKQLFWPRDKKKAEELIG